MDVKDKLIYLLKMIRNQKIMQNIRLVDINNNKELIIKGIMFDDQHTCYHSYEQLEDVITGLIISANNYGIYLGSEFIGIISVFYQYYKDLTRLEVSLSIKNEYRSKNIGKYCMDLILPKCFEKNNVKSIHLSIREDNIKSRKLAEKCRFKIYPGYKSCNTFTDLDGNKIPQVQYLLKRKDYIKK